MTHQRILLALLAALLAALAPVDSLWPQLRDDEELVLFPAVGFPARGGGWDVEIHGWVFEPEATSDTRQAFVALAWAAVGGASGDAREKEIFTKRLRPFLVDNERGKTVSVKICGKTRRLAETESNGHCRGVIHLSLAEVERERKDPLGDPLSLECEAVLGDGDSRQIRSRIQLLTERGLSVISDIDDTVKESHVLDKGELLKNTFLRESRAVPGMAELYAPLSRSGASFHYVTGSPWQLFLPLKDFLRAARLPAGSFHMRSFRLKDPGTLFEMFAAPVDHKRSCIEPLFLALPGREFVLVGDSGEKDPEVYGEVARKFPKQVRAIWIRDVKGEGPQSERIKKAFAEVPADIWRLFTDPGELGEAAKSLVGSKPKPL